MKRLFDKSLSALFNEDMLSLERNLNEMSDPNFIDKDGRTLIFHAVILGSSKAVELLLSKKAEINIKDKKGWFPLHYAVNGYFPEIVKLLIDARAEINSKDDFGNTVIWRAVFASKGKGEIIEYLTQNGADPSMKNLSGISALELADTIENYDVKQFLKPMN